MEVTRDVILDLLPLYLADEVSADTRALVDNYLETDPDLARMAEKSNSMAFADEVPVLLTKENKMEAYLEAKRLMFRRTLVWAGLIALTIFACLGMAALAFFMLSV